MVRENTDSNATWVWDWCDRNTSLDQIGGLEFGILSCGWGAKVNTLLIDDGAKTKGLGCAWPVHKQACASLY